MIKLFYARTSTKEQDLTRQLKWAESHGINKIHIYADKVTGKDFNRPKYQELWKDIEKFQSVGKKIELYCMEIDRLGRNKKLTLKEISKFKEKGVTLRLGNIPQTMKNADDAMTQMVQNIMIEIYTTMAQQEIDLKKERQKTAYESLEKDSKGRMISRKTGQVIGRPKQSLTKGQEALIKAWMNKEIKLSEVKYETGLSQSTLYRIKKEMMEEGR
jgi:DNA invertase Pin-like site-specific DNA recombinase